MGPEPFIALVIGMMSGLIAGLLARGRLSLRCLHCRASLPQWCADRDACARRRADIQRH